MHVNQSINQPNIPTLNLKNQNSYNCFEFQSHTKKAVDETKEVTFVQKLNICIKKVRSCHKTWSQGFFIR